MENVNSSSATRLVSYHDGILGAEASKFNYDIWRHIGPNRIHVRSNILEIGRGFYLKNALNEPNVFDSNRLSRLFRRATEEQFKPYFDEFIQKTSFFPDKFHNLHYTDLFYWEHRLAAHYGPNYRAGRPYFETYIIYNCRAILELMLSTNMANRKKALVMRHLIERMWPEVLEVPIFSGSKFLEFYKADASNAERRKPPIGKDKVSPGTPPLSKKRITAGTTVSKAMSLIRWIQRGLKSAAKSK